MSSKRQVTDIAAPQDITAAGPTLSLLMSHVAVPEALPALLGCGKTRRIKRGETLIAAGDMQPPVALISSGWIMRTRLRQNGDAATMGIFLPGDILGPEHLAMAPCIDTYTALTDADVLLTDVKTLKQAGAADGTIFSDIAAVLALDLHFLREALAALGYANAYERLLIFLFQTRERVIAKGLAMRGAPCPLPMTQLDLSLTVGNTHVHVNRVLKQLKRDGICSLASQVLIVHDEEAFAERAREAMGAIALGAPA